MVRTVLTVVVVLTCFSSHAISAADDKKPDALQAKTVWQGVSDPDPRWAERREVPARLRMLTRDGEKFTARIWFLKPHDLHGAEMEGRIKNGQLVAHITKILKGAWGDDAVDIVWEGKLDGYDLVLTRTNKRNMTASCRLKLDEKAKGSDADDPSDEKPKKGHGS